MNLHKHKHLKNIADGMFLSFTYQSYRISMKFILWKLKSKFREHS